MENIFFATEARVDETSVFFEDSVIWLRSCFSRIAVFRCFGCEDHEMDFEACPHEDMEERAPVRTILVGACGDLGSLGSPVSLDSLDA